MKQTKRIFSTILALCILLTLTPMGALAAEGAADPDTNQSSQMQGGVRVTQDGSKEHPYLIFDVAQLDSLRKLVNDDASSMYGYKNEPNTYFMMMNDINLLSEDNWTPIGTGDPRDPGSKPFKGIFDGSGYAVTNLKIDLSVDQVGLFGSADSGSIIQNLGVVSGSVSGGSYVGGVVGWTEGTIQNCYSTIRIKGTSQVGGVAGSAADMQNCYATGGAVTGNGNQVGGVVGNAGVIKNCYTANTVTGNGNQVGGVAGNADIIRNCIALCRTVTGKATATATDIGRVVGKHNGNSSEISGNYAWGGMQLNIGGIANTVSDGAANNPNGADLYKNSEFGLVTTTGDTFDWVGSGFTTKSGWILPSTTGTMFPPPSEQLPKLSANAVHPLINFALTMLSTVTLAGETPLVQQVEKYAKFTLPILTPGPGIRFDGWTADLDANPVEKVASDYLVTKDITLYPILSTLHALTVELNGGSGVTPGGSYAKDDKISIKAGTKDGYTFSGWTSSGGGSFTDANKADTEFTMPGNDTLITASFSQISSGGGDSGESSPSGVDAGKAKSDIAKAPEGGKVTIPMHGATTLPKDVLDAAKGKNVNLVFDFGGYSWTVNGKSIGTVPVGGVNLATKTIQISHLFDLSGKAGVEQLEIAYSGALPFDGVLDYKIGTEYNGKNLYLYYYDEGADALVYRSSAKVDGGRVKLVFDHASRYVLTLARIDLPENPFTDVQESDWCYEDILTVYQKGLLGGTTATTFSPDKAMTRGMFVTVLGRLAGIDTKQYTSTSFTDVAANAYYLPYIAWAVQTGITSGAGAATFSPDKAITRQQMAVLLQNYARAMGDDLPIVQQAVTFADANAIGGFAKDAVAAMQRAGVMSGKSGNRFDPHGAATRAQVAAVLRRYVELVAAPAAT